MTNREIRYELFECIATVDGIKDKLINDYGKPSVELMRERLLKMFEYFNEQYLKEIKPIDDLIDKTLL